MEGSSFLVSFAEHCWVKSFRRNLDGKFLNRFPGSGMTSACEPPDVGAKKQTQFI